MNILVTGGLGLIGSELTEQLTERGDVVWVVDDLSHSCTNPNTSPAEWWTEADIATLSRSGFRALEPHYIIHCASPVGHAMLRPEAHTAWRIIRDAQAVLELAEASGARLISLSSSEVLTYKGETDTRAQYALGKLTMESMVLNHPAVDGRVVRPYNVTGKRQRADGGFVMPRFREQARAGQPLTIFGSGEQVRHLTHVSDFARFICALVEKWEGPRRFCVFNPGNGATVKELVRLFYQNIRFTPEMLNARPLACLVDGAQALANPQWRDSSERPLDMAEFEACRRLGWEPRVGLEQIVREHLTGELQ